jgi:FixJ family two-component response regulator
MTLVEVAKSSESGQPTPADHCDGEIFIVDDDPAVRDALSMAFGLAGYRVRTFADGKSFLVAARAGAPACILLDVHLPDGSGLDILDKVDAGNYPAPVFMLSGRADIAIAVDAIKRGAFDFIEKNTDVEAMVRRVGEAVDAREHRHSNGDSPTVRSLSFPGCERLTPRERDVLAQITAGACNREAAKHLGISRRTVEVHRAHIMLKLGAKNSVGLIRKVLNKEFGL